MSYIPLIAVPLAAAAMAFWLTPAAGVLATLSAFSLMALPGIFIGIALFGWDVRRQPESLIFGVPIGLMLSGYVALMLGFRGHWAVLPISIALLSLTVVTSIYAARRGRTPLLTNLRPWEPADFGVLGAMGLTVLGFLAVPFSRIGELTPDGHAYAWLFGFDYILRSAYAASITIGLPIDHMHMAGVPLHMYLVGYVLPAFSYTLSGQAVHLQSILMVAEILLDLVFVGCLLAFWRLFARSINALLVTAALALVAYSYYGWFVIARHSAALLPASIASKLQDQSSFGSVSHLFQRLFMVEPQAILALSVFLLVLTLVLLSDLRSKLALSAIIGLAIGVEFGIDSWLALTLAAWFAGVQLMRLWGHWNNRQLWLQSLLVAGTACILWSTYFLVHMVDLSSGSLVSVRPYSWGLKFGVLQYAIEYGAMFPLGLLGLWSLWRSRRIWALSLGLIAGIAICQDLFVTIAYLPHFRVGNRLLPIVLLAGAAWLFDHVTLTRAIKGLVLAAMIFAVPTFFTDIHGASNIYDVHETFYVSSADAKACEWIRTHLPKTAIIQSKPDYIGDYWINPLLRGANEISLIPDFALRKSALGAEYSARSVCAGCDNLANLREADMDTMFRSADGAGVASMAGKYKIDYLYVGPYEENQFPQLLSTLGKSVQFKQVYDQDSVHVYQVIDTQSALQSLPR